MAGPLEMHPLRDLISLEEALDRIAAEVAPVERTERVEIAAAAGRVAAESVRARADGPAKDRSRMDGYAVASAELADLQPGKPKLLKIAGRASAGSPVGPMLQPGTCLEIATGAPLPPRADAVVPAEVARPIAGGQMAEFTRPVTRGSHVSLKGSDFRAGEELVGVGELLTPARVAAVATANLAQIAVRARARVVVVPTGDEVVPLGSPLAEGQVRDSNSHAVAAFVAARGALPDRHPLLRDTLEDVKKALEFGRNYEATVLTGGTSAGAKDFLAPALREVGEITFHGVRVRPGRPVVFGHALGRPILGLPGNPTSCMVDAHLFLERLLSALAGAPPTPTAAVRATLAEEVAPFVDGSGPDFTTLVLVRLEGGRARPVLKDSMSVTGASRADGYVRVAPGKKAPAVGDEVSVVLMR